MFRINCVRSVGFLGVLLVSLSASAGVGPEIAVPTAGRAAVWGDVTGAATTASGFAVTGYSRSGGFYQTLGRDGTPTGPQIPLPFATSPPAIAAAGDTVAIVDDRTIAVYDGRSLLRANDMPLGAGDPRVAAGRDAFLVVWQSAIHGTYVPMAQFVGLDGALIGSQFAVAPEGFNATVASDGNDWAVFANTSTSQAAWHVARDGAVTFGGFFSMYLNQPSAIWDGSAYVLTMFAWPDQRIHTFDAGAVPISARVIAGTNSSDGAIAARPAGSVLFLNSPPRYLRLRPGGTPEDDAPRLLDVPLANVNAAACNELLCLTASSEYTLGSITDLTTSRPAVQLASQKAWVEGVSAAVGRSIVFVGVFDAGGNPYTPLKVARFHDGEWIGAPTSIAASRFAIGADGDRAALLTASLDRKIEYRVVDENGAASPPALIETHGNWTSVTPLKVVAAGDTVTLLWSVNTTVVRAPGDTNPTHVTSFRSARVAPDGTIVTSAVPGNVALDIASSRSGIVAATITRDDSGAWLGFGLLGIAPALRIADGVIGSDLAIASDGRSRSLVLWNSSAGANATLIDETRNQVIATRTFPGSWSYPSASWNRGEFLVTSRDSILRFDDSGSLIEKPATVTSLSGTMRVSTGTAGAVVAYSADTHSPDYLDVGMIRFVSAGRRLRIVGR